ncbi:MAG: universal stress protein [Thermoplasmataceae archaeon]
MVEAPQPYSLRLQKILVPMGKGYRSRRVLDIAFDLSRAYDSEITAFTVKETTQEVTWSDKVSLVTEAFKEGKDAKIKVVPRIRMANSVREGIVIESGAHGYDILLIATWKRSALSASLFGGIGDYVLKNSGSTTAALSVKNASYPYRKILVPISEDINTRTAVAFSLYLKKALNASLYFVDMRKYDKTHTHGYRLLFENMDRFVSSYGPEINFTKSGMTTSFKDEILFYSRQINPDLIVLGIRTRPDGGVRINAAIKSVIKGTEQDVLLVKK